MCLMDTFYTLIQLVMRHFGLIVHIIVLFSYELVKKNDVYSEEDRLKSLVGD